MTRPPNREAIALLGALLAAVVASAGETCPLPCPGHALGAAYGPGEDVARDDGSEEPRRRSDGRARPGRELFESLSDEERRELRKLFQLLKRRPPESRQRLLERLGRLAPAERVAEIARAKEEILRENADWARFEKELARAERDCRRRLVPSELRKRLSGVEDAEERRRIINEFCDREELGETRRRLLDDLPASVRARVEKYTPREQARFLRRYRGLELLRVVFPEEEERRDFLRRTPDELRVLLGHESAASGQTKPSRPDFITEGAWERWRELKAYERLRVLRTATRTRHGGGDHPDPDQK